MRVVCVNAAFLILVALIGCARSNNVKNDPVTEGITIEEAASIAISEVMSRETVKRELLHADARCDGNGWFVVVEEDSYRQAAFWHMHISSTGKVSKFSGGE